MNIELLAVGRTKNRFIVEGIDEYLKRLKRYVTFSLTELPDIRNAGKLTPEEQKEGEAKILLGKISNSDFVMLLDERGTQFTSIEFSMKLQSIMGSGRKRLLLVIGGPYGFSKSLYERADALLSLSKMTFNHEMVRLFIIEQIYRSMTILRGEPYHHE